MKNNNEFLTIMCSKTHLEKAINYIINNYGYQHCNYFYKCKEGKFIIANDYIFTGFEKFSRRDLTDSQLIAFEAHRYLDSYYPNIHCSAYYITLIDNRNEDNVYELFSITGVTIASFFDTI